MPKLNTENRMPGEVRVDKKSNVPPLHSGLHCILRQGAVVLRLAQSEVTLAVESQPPQPLVWLAHGMGSDITCWPILEEAVCLIFFRNALARCEPFPCPLGLRGRWARQWTRPLLVSGVLHAQVGPTAVGEGEGEGEEGLIDSELEPGHLAAAASGLKVVYGQWLIRDRTLPFTTEDPSVTDTAPGRRAPPNEITE
ncbi:hypothetical protein AAFF_G00429810 [Aldrovandia affinis]|uniref:Uncharacterized protein n=1 Tax=Aldrovandia affinis TaxID=143900 RepID=A0AAD7S9E7_9TELE|nr:hypothetical protein AAFF_G00429810 [Aldrovandia affinis]